MLQNQYVREMENMAYEVYVMMQQNTQNMNNREVDNPTA